MRLGIIGTGLIGEPLAKKLLGANYELNIFNRTISKTIELKDLGAKVCNDVSSLINESDTIILLLTDFDAISEVLFKSNISDYDGKTIIQMSTIAPSESKEINERIKKLRGEYLEAPVLGSIPQIIKGELIVLVGSTEKQFQKSRKIFFAFSNKVLHIGKNGDASAMKLALNQLIVTQTIAFSMSLGYLQENNIDINKFMNILRDSALYAPAFDNKLPKMLARDFSNPNFPLKHLLKDLDLILGDFGESKINTNALKGIRKILIDSIQKGFADDDYSALYNEVHPTKHES